MIQGAIFDLDGTLLDSMGIWDTLGERFLRTLGYAPKADINARFQTFTVRQAAEHYQTVYGVPLTVEALMDGIHKTIAYDYFHTVELKPGVREFLAQLSQNGVKMCIATATDLYLVKAAIQRLGIADCFSDILTCAEVGHGKDQPTIYRNALESLGTEKSHTVVLEDALHALKTAKADGFTTIGIFDSHNAEQEAIRAYSDIYLCDFIQTNAFWKFAEQL